ncbi:MAG: hypothetical protein OXC81_03675, partial [Betaproteobacteria bacterium]|nr:hypothetical protein [Betaproteobacteria bacterium]
MAKAVNFDHEKKNAYTLTLRATHSGASNDAEFVLRILNIDEAPFFDSSETTDILLNGRNGGSAVFVAAKDPEGVATMSYSAELADGSPLPSGVTFESSEIEFTVAPGTSEGNYQVKLRAEQSEDPSKYDEVQLNLRISSGIVASPVQFALSKIRRSAVLDVALDQLPSGGNVTLTLVGANTQIESDPNELVFTPTNWNVVQKTTVSITDSGLMVKGERNINFTIAVHDRSSSATNYRAVNPFILSADVNVINEFPVFPETIAPRAIDENDAKAETADGASIGAPVTATDQDNPTGLVYSINPASPLFGIDATSGQITLKGPANLNHEKQAAYTVNVEVHDNEPSAVRGDATTPVVIRINNVDEDPDDYSSVANFRVTSHTHREIVLEWENSDGGTGGYYGQFDEADRLSIIISYGTGSTAYDPVELAPDQEAVTLTGLAGGSDYDITVRWYSADNLYGASQITLDETTDANSAPVFTSSSLMATISEGVVTASNQAVATVVATDAESDTISYSIVSDADGANFIIGASNGIVIADLGRVFDYENKDLYTINIRADEGTTSTDGALVLTIRDVSGEALAFDRVAVANIALTLDENDGKERLASDTNIGTPVAAAGVDNAVLSYGLVGGSSEFKIVPATGQLQAVAELNFNHERQASYVLTVQARSAGMSALATVTVQINSIDERPENYTGHRFALLGSTRNELTMSWSNVEYENQFDAVDQERIEVSYGGGGGLAATVTLAAVATQVRLVGLTAGSYDLTIHWFSADNIAQNTPVIYRGATVDANNSPVFSGSLNYSRRENVAAQQTAAGTRIGVVSASDA